MTLREIKDLFKIEYGWTDGISIGKIDRDKDKAICFYPTQTSQNNITTVGGKKNRGYEKRKVTVLLRYGTNAAKAEEKAKNIYDFFDEKEINTDVLNIFTVMRYSEPISLGTDDDGIYEYTLEFEIYERRN